MKEIRVYLEDISESIAKIEEYTGPINLLDFENNTEHQDAVIRRLEIIGEAAKNIPSGIKENYPAVPWKQITGMRDVLIHEYAGVSLARVWKAVTDDLPLLKSTVEQILKTI